MVTNFYKDNKAAKLAENIVHEILNEELVDFLVYNVSEIKQYNHKGDIQCVHVFDAEPEIFIDVKDDGVIHRTGNFLAEYEVFFKEHKNMEDGFMRKASYDYIAVVSRPDMKIYFLDFKKWQECYTQGYYKVIPHPEQITYGYLMKKEKARQLGVLLAEISYHYHDGEYHLKKGSTIRYDMKQKKAS